MTFKQKLTHIKQYNFTGSLDQLQQLPDTGAFLQLLSGLDGPSRPVTPASSGDAPGDATGVTGGVTNGVTGGVTGGAGDGADSELPERRAARGLFRCVCVCVCVAFYGLLCVYHSLV